MPSMMCHGCKDMFAIDRKNMKVTQVADHAFCCADCLLKVIRGSVPNFSMRLTAIQKPLCMDKKIRSKFEYDVGKWFALKREEVEHEPCAIRLGDGSRYVPDWYFPKYGIFLEVKGEWTGVARNKFKAMQDRYPRSIYLVPWHMQRSFT